MAVLDEVPGIEVTVQVKGQNATEYVDPYASDPDPDANFGCPVISKYIESIDDAEFSIEVAVDDDKYAWGAIKHILSARVEVDGRGVGKSSIRPGDGGVVRDGQNRYSEESQQWYCRKLKFSAINIVENRNALQVLEDKDGIEDVGLIQVSLERRVVTSRETHSPKAFMNTNTLEVAEKALKGTTISHSVSLGKPVITQEVTKERTRRVAVDNGPIAVFRFLYRSRESLKRELIIPRSLSPERVVPKIPLLSIDDLTMAEVRRLAQERLDQINWARAAKSHQGTPMKRQASEVVGADGEEKKVHPAKRRALTIDLTDD